MPTPVSERRRAARVAATFPIQLGSGDQSRPARLKDLSEIGLCCAANQQIPEMTKVAIEMLLPGTKQKHTLEGAVVRCEPMRGKQPPVYDLAVYFTDINDAAKAAIRGYVSKGRPV